MELSWVGHSCFRMRGREATVITDPCARSSGYNLVRATADLVTVSNSHPHHSYVEGVDGEPMVLDGPGEYEVRGIFVTGVRTSQSKTLEPVRNTAYVIRVDDITFCHLGDIAAPLTSEQTEVMKDVDVLLVPVGGHCTIGPSEAVEVIARVEPKLVIPMHYGTEDGTVELEDVERFLREMGLGETPKQNRLNITRSNLPAEPTVTVMAYRR